MTSFESWIAKYVKSSIPKEHQEEFLTLLSKRYRTGHYRLPKSIVEKYSEHLQRSPYKSRNCTQYYLREFKFLPPQALYDYYLILLKGGFLTTKVH